MGNCIYCGKSAGIFKNFHKDCRQAHELEKSKIVSIVSKVGIEDDDIQLLEASIKQIASSSYIDKPTLDSLLISGWEKAVDTVFEEGVLAEKRANALGEFQKHFSLSKEDLDQNGAFTKIVKGAVLSEVLEGKLPERILIEGSLPFNLQKSEKLVWIFRDVDYYEEKTKTRYIGGSQGISIRMAKGLYFRTGAFQGERVQTSETIHIDTGLLGVTNKHIYFVGPLKKFRINYNKIVSFEPFSNGIGVQRDAQTAKPQSFSTGDGWFTYNLITNLAQM